MTSEPSDDVPFRVQLRENMHGLLSKSYFIILPADRWLETETLEAYKGM